MEPLDFDNMSDEEKRRASSPIGAWIIVVVFALVLVLGIRYGSGEELHATVQSTSGASAAAVIGIETR
jgi:flagellin-like protein